MQKKNFLVLPVIAVILLIPGMTLGAVHPVIPLCDTNQDGVITSQEMKDYFDFFKVYTYPLDVVENKIIRFEQSLLDRINIATPFNQFKEFYGKQSIPNGILEFQEELDYWHLFFNAIREAGNYDETFFPNCEPLIIPEPEPDPIPPPDFNATEFEERLTYLEMETTKQKSEINVLNDAVVALESMIQRIVTWITSF